MDRTQRILDAVSGSWQAAERLRRMKEVAEKYPPRPAVGHMPFPGHRDQGAVARAHNTAAARRARAYGYEGPWG